MRILIAEDDKTSRCMLSAVLTKAGYTVTETTNGAEAWAVLQQEDAPKIAILDWMMPDMDGLEVIRRVHDMQADEPPYLIMLTTMTDKNDIVAGLDAGANDYLTKPFDAGELRARVAVGCRMVDMRRALAIKVGELQQALAEIKTLRGIVPICAGCKKIRDDKGFWQQVEVYIHEHSEAKFSHGLCPDCIRELYADVSEADIASI